jgi:hypothetical protein
VLAIDDLAAWPEYSYAQRLTDGLPTFAPTRQAVERLLAGAGRPPEAELGTIPPRGGVATVEAIAANAVMAGCLPEHLPLVLAALEAMLDESFNLRGVQTTTHSCWPLAIVSGPVVERIGMAHRESVFSGGGSRANLAIGRAIRLVLWNVGGAFPGQPVKEVFGHPGRLGYCVAESPDSPWPSLFDRLQGPDRASRNGGVVVFACEAPHSVAMWGVGDAPEQRLESVADAMRTLGSNNSHTQGEMLVGFTPAEARHLATHGWTPERVQGHLYERAQRRVGELRPISEICPDRSPENWQESWPDWIDQADPDARVPSVDGPGSIHIAATGADSIPWAVVCPGWGSLGGAAVTRPLAAPGADAGARK